MEMSKESARIHSKILTESQIKEQQEIDKIITEELGINDEVSRISYYLTKEAVNNPDDKQLYRIVLNGEAWGVVINISNVEKNSDIQSEERDYNGITFFSNRIIQITAYRVNGKIKPNKFREVVAHEILHAFNIATSKKDGFIRTERNFNIYKKAVEEIKNGVNDINKYIGYVIYLSNKFEANAFENGLYSFLMSCDLMYFGDEKKAMTESMFYKRLVILIKANKAIKDNKEEATRIIETIYGKTFKWLEKLSEKSLKNCRRQIGRAVVKFRKDYDWTHGGKILSLPV